MLLLGAALFQCRLETQSLFGRCEGKAGRRVFFVPGHPAVCCPTLCSLGSCAGLTQQPPREVLSLERSTFCHK